MRARMEEAERGKEGLLQRINQLLVDAIVVPVVVVVVVCVCVCVCIPMYSHKHLYSALRDPTLRTVQDLRRLLSIRPS